MHEGFWRQAASGGPQGGGDGPGSPPGGGSATKLKGKRAALPKRKAMRALAKATRCVRPVQMLLAGWLCLRLCPRQTAGSGVTCGCALRQTKAMVTWLCCRQCCFMSMLLSLDESGHAHNNHHHLLHHQQGDVKASAFLASKSQLLAEVTVTQPSIARHTTMGCRPRLWPKACAQTDSDCTGINQADSVPAAQEACADCRAGAWRGRQRCCRRRWAKGCQAAQAPHRRRQ